MSSLPEFLTVDETAELLRINRNSLYGAIKLGQIPGVMRIGRVIRIRRADLTLPPQSDLVEDGHHGSPLEGPK